MNKVSLREEDLRPEPVPLAQELEGPHEVAVGLPPVPRHHHRRGSDVCPQAQRPPVQQVRAQLVEGGREVPAESADRPEVPHDSTTLVLLADGRAGCLNLKHRVLLEKIIEQTCMYQRFVLRD